MSANMHEQNSVLLNQIRKVRVSSLVPIQQPTRPQLLTSADCYQQRFIKFQDIATCHSYAEYLYALLLEADNEVKAFVPQPFKLRILNKIYVPDFFVLKNQQEYVFELKGSSGMDETLKMMVEGFFAHNGMKFHVVANEEVLKREQEALNWLPIIQVLVFSKLYDIDTSQIEYEVLETCCEFGSSLLVGDLFRTWGKLHPMDYREIALYRLIHKHHLAVDISFEPLSFNTELRVCI